MNYIPRANKELKKLSDTNKKFQEKIEGLTKEQAYRFYKNHEGTYKYNTDETKEEFAKMNHKRCSFCTRHLAEFDKEMTVEHIETKVECPEKIFRWDNLLCACHTCNTSRGKKRYMKDTYLDPSKIIDIERYFCFHADGSISANNALSVDDINKAKYMIELYKLDRKTLNTDRREFFNSLLDDEYFQILKKRSNESQDIHFLAVFAYYKRRTENGKQGVYIGSDNNKKSADGVQA